MQTYGKERELGIWYWELVFADICYFPYHFFGRVLANSKFQIPNSCTQRQLRLLIKCFISSSKKLFTIPRQPGQPDCLFSLCAFHEHRPHCAHLAHARRGHLQIVAGAAGTPVQVGMRGIRGAIIVITIAAAGCGGNGPSGVSVCENQIPPPAACMTQCDPAPGAPTTCPGGYHCTADGKCDAVCTQGGGECGEGYRCTPDGRCVGNDECIGLECKIVKCDAQGKPPTSISGTVTTSVIGAMSLAGS